jgi:hypothetical protein
MKRNTFTWIMVGTLVLGELHSMFPDTRESVQNWIFRGYKPMTLCWNLWYLESQVIRVLYFVAFLFWKPTKVNITTIRSFVLAGILDIALYFYNFKDPLFFGSFYVWMAAIWFLVYYWKTSKGIEIRQLFLKRWKRCIKLIHLFPFIKRR